MEPGIGDDAEEDQAPLLENDLFLLHGHADQEDEDVAVPALCDQEAAFRSLGSRKRAPRRAAAAARAALLPLEPGAEVVAGAAAPLPALEDQAQPSPSEQQPSEAQIAATATAKRRKFESKPVEARHEGDEEAPWLSFPSLASAGRETGVPCGSISSLCDLQGGHSGWVFRWPGAAPIKRPPPPPSRPVELSPEETECILRRLRAMPQDERRAAVAAMPEGTRRCLTAQLRSEAGGSRLRSLLENLPQLLEGAPEHKCKAVLQGVRLFESKQAEILAAPDIATVAKLLKEVSAEQRRCLLEFLPGQTQQALMMHLRAEKAAQAQAAAVEACVRRQASEHQMLPGVF